MRFDAVIFDMGDILYDASTWRRWLTEELRRQGVDISYHELVARWEALLVDVYRGQADYWLQFGELLRGVEVAPDVAAAVTDAARLKAVEVQSGRQPMDGVPETLALLRDSGMRLGVLSDTESGSARVRGMLDDLGIETYFDAVVTSADIGYVKPEPEAFLAAAAALEADVSSCAFVGHDVDELEGAQQAGLFAVAYNYDPKAPADVRLDHFSQLSEVLLRERVIT